MENIIKVNLKEVWKGVSWIYFTKIK